MFIWFQKSKLYIWTYTFTVEYIYACVIFQGKKKKKKGKDEPESSKATDTKAEGAPPADDKPKKVKKLKLEMCDDQAFYDGREVRVHISTCLSNRSYSYLCQPGTGSL